MFRRHCITRKMLDIMTNDDYKEIGVTIVGDRVLMRTKLKSI